MTTAPTSSRRGPLLAVLALVIVVAGAAGTWYLFFRPAGPPPVSLATLLTASATASAGPGAASEAPSASAAAGASASSDIAADDGITGAWAVDSSVGSFSDFSSTFVGYRVREELASIGAAEAVGRTPDVTGSLTIDGTTITAGEISADLTTLRSDESNRDRQLQRQALETSQFPTATFTLTQPVDLGSVPAVGATVDLTLTGDLTLHGVTNTVQVPVAARLQGGVITVVGSLPIAFADYGIAKPQSMVVLSVEDNGTMEFQVHFSRA
jgi:polyisoprenoid-binding protein YceI